MLSTLLKAWVNFNKSVNKMDKDVCLLRTYIHKKDRQETRIIDYKDTTLYVRRRFLLWKKEKKKVV